MRTPVTIKDLIHDEMIFNGSGEIEEIANGISIKMKDPHYESEWKIYKRGCVIENQTAESKTRVVLKSGTGGFASVICEGGTIQMPAVLEKLKSSKDCIEIRYRIPDQDQSFHFQVSLDKKAGKKEQPGFPDNPKAERNDSQS